MQRAAVRVVLEILIFPPQRRLLDDFQMELVVRNVKANSEIGKLVFLKYQAEVLVLRQPPNGVQLC